MANFFIKLVNYLISGVGAALTWVIGLLPDSPFSSPAAPPGAVNLGYVTWLIPFPTMMAHMLVLLGAIAIYYIIRVAARWVKVARG